MANILSICLSGAAWSQRGNLTGLALLLRKPKNFLAPLSILQRVPLWLKGSVKINATLVSIIAISWISLISSLLATTAATANSTSSVETAAAHIARIPIPPSSLTAKAAFATEIFLTWRNNAVNATSNTIQRSTDNIYFTPVATVSSTATSYIDTYVAPATTYYYNVFASNASGSSGNSNIGSAQTTVAVNTNPYVVYTEPNINKPAYMSKWTDPVFGTKITRIANSPAASFTTANDGPGTWSKIATHHYSLSEPWSTDGSLYVIENRGIDGGSNGGAGGDWLNLDGSMYFPKLGPPTNYPAPGADERWNPNSKYPTTVVMAGHNQAILWWFDIAANAVARSWNLPFVPQDIGSDYGNVSQNGRFVVLNDTTQTEMAVVDMDPQPPFAPYPSPRIGPVYNIESNIGGAIYSVAAPTVDPSGKYVVISYAYKNGVSGYHYRVYDIDPDTLALSLHVLPSTTVQCERNQNHWLYALGHIDLALNPYDNYEPVMVGREECGWGRQNVAGVKTVNSGGIGNVLLVRLRDGAVTSLTDPGNWTGTPLEAYAVHQSARNLNMPGWAFVTYGAWPGEQTSRYYDEIIAVSMDGRGRVQRLAHTHSDFANFTSNNCQNIISDFNYRSEPHGVPSPDGKRLAFDSNWLINGNGTGGCSIEDFVIDLRP